MKEHYEDMSVEELNREFDRIKGELEDLEETFHFNLTHTSAHLSSGAVAEHEAELEEYKERIEAIERILEKKGG